MTALCSALNSGSRAPRPYADCSPNGGTPEQIAEFDNCHRRWDQGTVPITLQPCRNQNGICVDTRRRPELTIQACESMTPVLAIRITAAILRRQFVKLFFQLRIDSVIRSSQ